MLDDDIKHKCNMISELFFDALLEFNIILQCTYIKSISFQFNAFGDCAILSLRSEAQLKKDAPVHLT